MLEPIRQYGQELLEQSRESEILRSRHATYYLKLAEEADANEAQHEFRRARPAAWLRQMEAEHANLRAALFWSLDEDTDHPDGHDESEGGRVELGQREDIPLRTVMEELGELKPHLENRNTLAYLLILEGMIALSQSDLEHSGALHEESLDTFARHRMRGVYLAACSTSLA